MNDNKTVYANKAMSRVAIVGVNSVGWVMNPQSNTPEILIFVTSTGEWISPGEHERRKLERGANWLQKRHYRYCAAVPHYRIRNAERALQI